MYYYIDTIYEYILLIYIYMSNMYVAYILSWGYLYIHSQSLMFSLIQTTRMRKTIDNHERACVLFLNVPHKCIFHKLL